MRLTTAIRLVFVAALAVAVVIFLSRGPNSILTGNIPPNRPAAVVVQDSVTERTKQVEADQARIRALADELIEIVEREFYNEVRLGPEWEAAKAMLPRWIEASSLSNAPQTYINSFQSLLRTLSASHTSYYTKFDRQWYDILDIFMTSTDPLIRETIEYEFKDTGGDRVLVESIGVFYHADNRGSFLITDVVPGSTGDSARIRVGDRITHPYMKGYWNPCIGLNGDPDKGVLQISGLGTIELETQLVNPTEEYLDYMTNSASVIERDSKKLGYVRIYSWAGQHYQDRFEELLAAEPLASADGVVLDIRGGWGGANPQYLDLFDAPMPKLTHMPRDGESFVWDPSEDLPARTFYWRKPVVLLVDGGSRSGKEIIAYAFKKHAIGPVVGERTAGAVLAGRPFILSDGSLLYLAVADVLVDGERLEGVGVEPDIVVERDLPFSNGADPQLDAAYGALLSEIATGSE